MATTKGTRRSKKKPESWARRNSLALLIAAVAVPVIVVAVVCYFTFNTYKGPDVTLRIPRGATQEQVKDSLKTRLGSSDGMRVYLLWRLRGGKSSVAHGSYEITAGRSAMSLASMLKNGNQSPVKVSFPPVRRFTDLAERVTRNLEISPDEFLAACDSILPGRGYKREEFPAAFLPDTYEFYWSATGATVVNRLLDYRDRFWTPERRDRAKAMGLTEVEVATLASIVEEETAKADERPRVARLYLNRLDKKMRLQADPTVKFATGDASLRRITGKHLEIESPYNTYKIDGLPPGPIRVPAAATLDAVLEAPLHPYLYMCAKEDFSGYHNFATDYATHKANARRYQAELNRRNIR